MLTMPIMGDVTPADHESFSAPRPSIDVRLGSPFRSLIIKLVPDLNMIILISVFSS